MGQFPKPLRFAFLLFIGLWALASCNKSTSFGADLLEDEAADLTFTDTLSMDITIIEEDSVRTSDATSVSAFMLCGKIDEPVFGESEAILYTALRPQFGFTFADNTVVDSVTLYLGYEADATIGDTNVLHTFEIFQLDQPVLAGTSYYSNNTLPYSNQIGSASFMPTPSTGSPLIDSSNFSATGRDSVFGAYLRIPLDVAFGQSIVDLDSTALSTDSVFVAQTRGLAIRSTQAGAILGFDMNNASFSHVLIHYTQDDTLHLSYKIRFGGANKFAQFTHNRPQSLTDKIGQSGNEKLYLQGLGGLKAKVEFPHIGSLKDLLINKAELVFTVDEVDGVNLSQFDAPNQLIYTHNQGDSLFVLGPDPSYALSVSSGSFGIFGGNPEIESGKTVYRINLSEYMQDMALGLHPGEVYINIYPQANAAGRVALFGPKSVTFPAKLNLKYTKIQ